MIVNQRQETLKMISGTADHLLKVWTARRSLIEAAEDDEKSEIAAISGEIIRTREIWIEVYNIASKKLFLSEEQMNFIQKLCKRSIAQPNENTAFDALRMVVMNGR